jgi:hypothetical protein
MSSGPHVKRLVRLFLMHRCFASLHDSDLAASIASSSSTIAIALDGSSPSCTAAYNDRAADRQVGGREDGLAPMSIDLRTLACPSMSTNTTRSASATCLRASQLTLSKVILSMGNSRLSLGKSHRYSSRIFFTIRLLSIVGRGDPFLKIPPPLFDCSSIIPRP